MQKSWMQCYVVLNIILIAVPPPIKHIQETKTMHTLTLQLLNHLCTEVLKVSRAKEIFRQSFITGAKYGILIGPCQNTMKNTGYLTFFGWKTTTSLNKNLLILFQLHINTLNKVSAKLTPRLQLCKTMT